MSGATGKRIGKYDVQATLATSPRARVFRGFDSETKRPVALKVIPRSHLNASALPDWRMYAQTLGRLEHPGIAAFFELVENEKAVCLVSELCEGVPLSGLLKDGAQPEMKNVWEISRRLLEALAYAHMRGAVHRDLKPANVILAPDGGLKITDFGAAALYSEPSDMVFYHAPEQFASDPVTARTDIYQAGAIIYHLVTGRLPFSGTPAEVEHRVLQERPSDPSSYDNHIAWQLDWVIQKAMSKAPVERFNAATDFAEGLRLGLQDTIGRPLDPIVAPTALKSAVPPPPQPVREPTKPPVEAAPARPSTAGDSAAPATGPTAEVEPAPSAPAKPGDPHAAPAKPGDQQPAAAAIKSAIPSAGTAAPAPNLAQKAQALARPAPPATPVPSAPKAATRARVLFVDDDERILNAVRALFRQDYDVVTAAGGEAALASLRESTFHVVVSDQRMPGVTGVELLRQARSLAPDAVRILLTGYTDLAALVGSINQGEIFKFVMKPWDNEELKKAVAEAARIALELAAAPPKPAEAKDAPPAHPRTAGSLLVIDPQDGLAKGLERLLAGAARVMQVATPQEAAKVLQGEEVAAIVADLGAGTDGLVALFKQLKEKRPEILSILLAEEPDSELGIELINKAQIYRFLPKPVSAKELRTQVAAALRRYATLKQTAALQKTAGGAATPSVAAERARATPPRLAT